MKTLALRYRFYYELNRLRTNLKNGLISQKQFLREKIRLLKGKRVGDITNVLKGISVTPNAKKALNNLRNEGFKIGLISDDPEIIIKNFAEIFKLDFVICNNAEIRNGRFTGKIRFAKNIDDYENWKKEVVKELKKNDGSEIITVGSESIDAPMLREANIGIAFNASKKAKKAADIVIDEPDMDEVLNSILESE